MALAVLHIPTMRVGPAPFPRDFASGSVRDAILPRHYASGRDDVLIRCARASTDFLFAAGDAYDAEAGSGNQKGRASNVLMRNTAMGPLKRLATLRRDLVSSAA